MIRAAKNKSTECPTCEQPFQLDLSICPHCHSEYQIGLEMTHSEFANTVDDLRSKLNQKDDPAIKQELSKLLYIQAMKLKYDDPPEALSLFGEVVELDPEHWEARLKVSWLSIRFTKNHEAIAALLPVVESKETTLLQKQRAYTNLSCAENWKDKGEADYLLAEKWAREGIALDNEGTAKLWENLATALRNQGKLEEARLTFKRAIKINPKSLNAIERQASIEKHLRIQKKNDGGMKRFHLKSPRDLLGGKKKSQGEFVKI